jgi:CDP-glucose 4,6-dehydratase
VKDEGRYTGRPVLVTGAQGFIGSWLARRLLDDGARVIAPARPARQLDPRCEAIELDLLDMGAIRGALERHGIVAVFHLAAQSTLQVAFRDPFETFEINVRGTYSLLDAIRTSHAPVERVVVASSYLAYGATRDGAPGVESALWATFPYEVSKACADEITQSYARTYGVPAAVLRLANVYGGGDFNFTRLVPETARSLIRGEPPVLRSDGTPERDFLYVEDAVDAYLAVAASLDDEAARGRAWNGGAGETVPVLDVVQRLIAAAESDVDPVIQGSGPPPGERELQAVDSSALREELGWRPSWQLDRGLTETYRWYERELS